MHDGVLGLSLSVARVACFAAVVTGVLLTSNTAFDCDPTPKSEKISSHDDRCAVPWRMEANVLLCAISPVKLARALIEIPRWRDSIT